MPKPFSLLTRTLHWLNAVCVIGLAASGWAIYNAAPFYPFEFPTQLTLGGYLTPALRWHFFFMWGLLIALPCQLIVRIWLCHGGPSLAPIHLRSILVELQDILQFNLQHTSGLYNHTQRLLYLLAFVLLVLAVASGLALWKPIQLQVLADSLGGYEAARRWHFWSMVGVTGFFVVHVTMVIVVPNTLLAMVFGAKPTGDKS